MFKKNKILYFAIALLLLSHKSTYAASTDMVNFQNGSLYTSSNIYKIALALAKKYPNLIELEVIGYSYDKKPIYVLRLSDANEENSKQHFLVHAGLHARETYNPFVLMKIIEDYINDYYDDSHLSFVNMQRILENNIIHFIPLSNPDGFDIVKNGPNTIQNVQLRNYFKTIITENYNRLKSNARGVDLNRNFENFTLDRTTHIWVDDLGKKQRDAIVRMVPSIDFYPGKTQGSEIETQILQGYFLKYDFRVYLSYHSMGRIVYGHTKRFGSEIQHLIERYVSVATKTTGYARASDLPQISSWGYEDRFVTSHTSKPLITIETLNTSVFPTPSKFYKFEYQKYKLNQIPIVFIQTAQNLGYFDHKLYKDGNYVRDYIDLDYAHANASRINGYVVSYKGEPILNFAPPEGFEVSEPDTIENLDGLKRGLIMDNDLK